MASERQIAANRRNAQKSTGPRSVEGKKRVSRNAYRHGLAAGVWHSGKSVAEIDALASDIAAAATGSVVAAADAEILAFARTAAQAELDLARIRGMKTVTMNSIMAAASLSLAVVLHDIEMDHLAISPSGQPLFERAPTPVTSLPLSRPTGHAEALRRSLTELLIVDRYEQRVVSRRDRAVLHVIARYVLTTVIKSTNWRTQSDLVSGEKGAINASGDCNLQNEPNFIPTKSMRRVAWSRREDRPVGQRPVAAADRGV